MSRCPTPDYSPRLSPEAMQLRNTAPSDYPCFTENGYYQFKSGCRSLCCIVPAHMAGDDSPAWQEHEQLRAEEEHKDKMPVAALDFDDEVAMHTLQEAQGTAVRQHGARAVLIEDSRERRSRACDVGIR